MKATIGTPTKLALLIKLCDDLSTQPDNLYEQYAMQTFQKHGLYDPETGVTRKGHEVIREACKAVIE